MNSIITIIKEEIKKHMEEIKNMECDEITSPADDFTDTEQPTRVDTPEPDDLSSYLPRFGDRLSSIS